MDSQLKSHLVATLEHHNASVHEMNFWLSRLEAAPREICENVIALFNALPGELKWLTQLQIKKEQALAANDPAVWHAVLEEEASHLSALNQLTRSNHNADGTI